MRPQREFRIPRKPDPHPVAVREGGVQGDGTGRSGGPGVEEGEEKLLDGQGAGM